MLFLIWRINVNVNYKEYRERIIFLKEKLFIC